jgi:hypothetical protein
MSHLCASRRLGSSAKAGGGNYLWGLVFVLFSSLAPSVFLLFDSVRRRTWHYARLLSLNAVRALLLEMTFAPDCSVEMSDFLWGSCHGWFPQVRSAGVQY